MGRLSNTTTEVAFGRELGQAVQRERLDRKLTGEDLARDSRVSVDQIRSIEQGKVASPGLYKIARIAVALGVSIDSLTPVIGDEA